jgi:hypothetical protein
MTWQMLNGILRNALIGYLAGYHSLTMHPVPRSRTVFVDLVGISSGLICFAKPWRGQTLIAMSGK